MSSDHPHLALSHLNCGSQRQIHRPECSPEISIFGAPRLPTSDFRRPNTEYRVPEEAWPRAWPRAWQRDFHVTRGCPQLRWLSLSFPQTHGLCLLHPTATTPHHHAAATPRHLSRQHTAQQAKHSRLSTAQRTADQRKLLESHSIQTFIFKMINLQL